MKRSSILLAALLAGCSTTVVNEGSQTVEFTLHQVSRAEIADLCGPSPIGRPSAACHLVGHIWIPGDAPSTRHTVVLHEYRKAPCPIACVIDGEIHTDVRSWYGHGVTVLGDAVVEATGADVPYNRRELFGHEFRHAAGYTHEK